MLITRKKINSAIKAAGIEGITLERGKEYYYFKGSQLERVHTTSVLVPRLNCLSVDQWIEELKCLLSQDSSPVDNAPDGFYEYQKGNSPCTPTPSTP